MANSSQPLARRILLALVLLTTVVSGLFSLSIVAVVHAIEDHLVSEAMRDELERIVGQDLPQQRAPQLNHRSQFYRDGDTHYPIPQAYQTLPEGFSEIVEDSEAYYVYRWDSDNNRYLLRYEQSEFEQREQLLFDVVLSGFLLSVLVAWVIGMLLAKKIMVPIRQLADQVRSRESGEQAPLAPNFADDEIGQLAGDFDAAFARVEQALARERLFTGDVSHELRTPLMVLQTASEVLADIDLPPEAQPPLAQIARARLEMQQLVQTFLQLARDKLQGAAPAQTADLAQVAQEQLLLWRPQFAAQQLQLALRDDGATAALYNMPLLATVLSNLLRNALHHTPRSGAVQVRLFAGGFAVADSGGGIAPAQRLAVFEPFVRGERAGGDGIGLGLSLVKRICSSQGWRVELVDSALGGAEFRVWLGGE